MGGCMSEQEQQNKAVGSELNEDRKLDKKVKKLLFLGSGGSGKSTIFKQLRNIHGTGYNDKAKLTFCDHIYGQIIKQMKELIQSLEYLKQEEPESFSKYEYSEEAEKSRKYVMEDLRSDVRVTPEIAKHIDILWKEECLKVTFGERARLRIFDSSEYFFNALDRISAKDYIPTNEDILMVRHRTTGVIEQKFEINKILFHVFDVGGQKSERKKWIHCFENVTAVIFVSSLSCYNEVLYEDETINSMQDALELFDNICNSNWFTDTNMILFLNKRDLLKEKLEDNISLKVCFDYYDGDDSYDDAVGFMKKKFMDLNQSNDKQVYPHVTCATDQNNIEKVFADVQHIVVSQSLGKGGLI